ncbi:hypothetical protein SteCoe_19044 [Stentor coeruleus]|uniref:Uncharacterized protein n=1 Tax=Stentor coeruleus TaxID=5963 RepID=A0A1R2BVQ2_9CILI|nr:hypothetical protein SteCoe_19044 [Stentor coeruleus]
MEEYEPFQTTSRNSSYNKGGIADDSPVWKDGDLLTKNSIKKNLKILCDPKIYNNYETNRNQWRSILWLIVIECAWVIMSIVIFTYVPSFAMVIDKNYPFCIMSFFACFYLMTLAFFFKDSSLCSAITIYFLYIFFSGILISFIVTITDFWIFISFYVISAFGLIGLIAFTYLPPISFYLTFLLYLLFAAGPFIGFYVSFMSLYIVYGFISSLLLGLYTLYFLILLPLDRHVGLHKKYPFEIVLFFHIDILWIILDILAFFICPHKK